MTYTLEVLQKEPIHRDGHRVKTSMEEVHVSPHEAEWWDHLQGGPQFTATGKRSYKKLGQLFKNPHIENMFHEHARSHFASGGSVGRNHHASEHNGRFGDTMVVEMPHHLCKVLDRAIGGPCYNPIDGKREYFLGALLGGAARLFGPMMSRLAPSLGSALGGLGRGFGNMAMSIGSGLGRGASMAGNALRSGMGSLANAAPRIGAGIGNALTGAAHAANAFLPPYMQYKEMKQMDRLMDRQYPPMQEQQYNGSYGAGNGGGYEPPQFTPSLAPSPSPLSSPTLSFDPSQSEFPFMRPSSPSGFGLTQQNSIMNRPSPSYGRSPSPTEPSQSGFSFMRPSPQPAFTFGRASAFSDASPRMGALSSVGRSPSPYSDDEFTDARGFGGVGNSGFGGYYDYRNNGQLPHQLDQGQQLRSTIRRSPYDDFTRD